MTITYAPGQSPDDAARALAEMRARLGNLQPVLTVQAESIRKLIDDSFRSSRAPDGSAWLPNAASTVARKGSAKPGIDTSLTRNSVTSVAGRNDITFGSNAPAASYLHNGTTRSGSLKNASSKPKRAKGTAFKVVVVARPFMPFTVEGTLITIGPAGKVFDRLARAVGTYVVTGKIT